MIYFYNQILICVNILKNKISKDVLDCASKSKFTRSEKGKPC